MGIGNKGNGLGILNICSLPALPLRPSPLLRLVIDDAKR